FNPEMYDGQDDGQEDAFDFGAYRNQDGGYQQDADYAEKAMAEMHIEDGGDAPVGNEALFAAEELSDDDE
ncbi:hypothetical protein GGI24_007111, partial [Coemansia furcata]